MSADYFVWETVLIEHPVACYTHTHQCCFEAADWFGRLCLFPESEAAGSVKTRLQRQLEAQWTEFDSGS